MSISRKQFLRNAGLLLGGAILLKQNIFAGNIVKQKTTTCLYDLFSGLNLTSDNTDFEDNDIIKQPDIPYAKSPVNANCKDVYYTDDCTLEVDDCLEDSSALKYDAYFPDATLYDYDACPLPAVIFVHGGTFSDCSYKDEPVPVDICYEFAKRYFVCFSVEYRRGRLIDDTIEGSPHTTAQQELAVYRACQDVRGAIRTIISRANSGDYDFKIDTNFIFLAGESAGSVAVLNAAYYPTQNMINQIFPKKSGSTYPTVRDVLGPIDALYYDSDRDYDYLDPESPNVRAVLNLWGSVALPPDSFDNESAFFEDNPYKPAIISFHGELDETFDFEHKNTKFSPSAEPDFHSESNCIINTSFTTFTTINNTSNDPDLITYGSKDIFTRVLEPLHIFREVYLDPCMGHGLGTTSGFGTGETNKHLVRIYIVKRAATFFQAIVLGIDDDLEGDTGINKIFENCCNVRKKGQLFNRDCTTSDCTGAITECP